MGEPSSPPSDEGERPAEEPAPPDPDSRPATAGDLRSLRRWLLVAVAWAIAATAIAAIALVVANRAADDDEALRTTSQLRNAQEDLAARLDRLETRVQALPTADDVSAVDDRLQQVEDDVSGLPDQIERLGGRLDDLEGRVDEVERQIDADADAAAAGGAGGTDDSAAVGCPHSVGCGFCCVVGAAEAEAAVALLAAHHPGAKVIGTVTDRAATVELAEQGLVGRRGRGFSAG